MEAIKTTAKATGVRSSVRKLLPVAKIVRGRTLEDARIILAHTPRRSATPILKVINSAAANAVHNDNAVEATLVVSRIDLGVGEEMRRYRPAAHGRALKFKRHVSNISVTLEGAVKPKTKKSDDKKTDAKKAKPAKTATKTAAKKKTAVTKKDKKDA